MKKFLFLCLCSLVKYAWTQCSLDVTLNGIQSRDALLGAVIGSEFNPSNFGGQVDLTYLCYVQDTTDPSQFTDVRISATFMYSSALRGLRANLDCRGTTWRYNTQTNSASGIDPASHTSTNSTMDDCRDCLDMSTESFGDPSWCNGEYLRAGW